MICFPDAGCIASVAAIRTELYEVAVELRGPLAAYQTEAFIVVVEAYYRSWCYLGFHGEANGELYSQATLLLEGSSPASVAVEEAISKLSSVDALFTLILRFSHCLIPSY